MSFRCSVSRRVRREVQGLESLDQRLLFAFSGEPNNSFATASTDSSNVYLEQNAVISDSVNTSTDVDDYYKFYTLYGQSHLYASMVGLSADADLYVYNQNEQLIASSTKGGNLSELINVDLSANQYVYVRVRGFASTNYSLYLYNDYAGSTLGTARDQGVSWGQTNSKFNAYGQIFISDYLDYRDNVDLFKFQLEDKAIVNLRRLSPVNGGGLPLTTDLVLYNSSGGVIANGFTNGSGLDIQNVSLNAGTYYVGVHQTQGSGQYSLRLVSDYAGSNTATARSVGNVYNTSRQYTDMVCGPFGFPSYDDASDLYKFTLSSAAPLTAAIDLQGQDPANFEASLFLAKDSNGDGTIADSERIASSQLTGNDKITLSTLAAGTYYLQVIPTKFYTTYVLDIDSDVDGGTSYKDLTKAQSFGTITSTTTKSLAGGFGISNGDITDFYKFTVNGQATINASVARDANNSRQTWTPGLSVLKDTNGNGQLDAGEILSSSSTGSLSYTLPAGTYYLDLSSSGGQLAYTGSATITPVSTSDGDDSISEVSASPKNVVATGGNVQFSLDTLKDVDIVRYVATAGQTIGFDIDGRNGTTPNTYLKLFKSDGTVLATNDNALAPGETNTTVSSYFKYTFATAGTYYLGVSLAGNTGYSPTTGNGDVNGAGPTGDYTLTAVKLAKISGNVFKDADGDGVKDAGETGLSGVAVYTDYDNDSAKDADEYSVTTDGSGNYSLYVPAGTWKVRQVVPSGYSQTLPSGGTGISVTATAGGSYTGKNFGDKTAVVSGTAAINGKVFNDKDGNGIIGGSENGYSGWTVYIDADNDSVLDASEKKATTDSLGNFKFSSLAAGTYKVRTVKPSGYTQTYPTNNFGQNVTLSSGQNATDKNFGFVLSST